MLGVGAQGQAFTAIVILTRRRRERPGVKQSNKQAFTNYFILFLSVEACLGLLSSSSAHLYCRKSLSLCLCRSEVSLDKIISAQSFSHFTITGTSSSEKGSFSTLNQLQTHKNIQVFQPHFFSSVLDQHDSCNINHLLQCFMR